MKKWFMAACAAGAIICAVAFKPSQKAETKVDACKYGYCSAIKKNGDPCYSCAQKGSSYCWSHGR